MLTAEQSAPRKEKKIRRHTRGGSFSHQYQSL